MIVSNPPYVAEGDWDGLQPEIRDFEPKAALVAGPDGLAADRALAPDCARLLAPGGLCALEIGSGQGDAVVAILRCMGCAAKRCATSSGSSAACSRGIRRQVVRAVTSTVLAARRSPASSMIHD